MIYVAGPYTHDDPKIMQERYEAHFRYTLKLLKAKTPCFSPICYAHQFVLHGLPPQHDDHVAFNEMMMDQSSAIHLLRLPDWPKSRGVIHELAYAADKNIPLKIITGRNLHG